MSRTHRTSYKGHHMRDGEWGKKCPEPNCHVCGIGRFNKRRDNRRTRHTKREGDEG